jgi:nicotinamide-nucleotide amidase
MTHTAEILAVGTEILLGNIANTDAQDVSQALSELGINVFFHTVVGDNPERVKAAVAIAKERADIIITTGGLGPTFDDLTKQTLAEAFGKRLVFDEASAQAIRDYFSKIPGAVMTENNMQQAYLPEGCIPFPNSCGTAPGCAFESRGKHVLMLPGPPRECRAMLKTGAIPYLKSLSDKEIDSHNIHIFGMGESAVEDRLHDIMTQLENPTLAPYAKDGECMLRVTAKADSKEAAEAMMAPVVAKVREILGDKVYGVDTGTLENTVLQLLIRAGKTVATAESCTGGLLAKRLTDIPGASAAFLGSTVTYSSASKAALLGVDSGVLQREGPVCETVACQMAEGVRKAFGADYGVGITGIAGPDSDGSGKEVGTVFVAMSGPNGTFCRSLHLGSDRSRTRTTAANHALDMIRRDLEHLPVC